MQRLQQAEGDALVFDNTVVRQVLARASEIQQRETSALSVAQIEALGAELGLSSEAVRRALLEVQRNTTGAARTDSKATLQQMRAAERKATIHSAIQSALWLTAALLLGDRVDEYNNGSASGAGMVGLLLGIVLFLLPSILAFTAGRRSGSPRLGAIRGLLAGAAMIVLLMLSVGSSQNPDAPGMATGRLWVVLYLLIIPTSLGAIGGAMQLRRNRRMQQSER